MEPWTAAATLILFTSPAGRQTDQFGDAPLPAVGPRELLSTNEFERLWSVFFAEKSSSSRCGLPQSLEKSDAHWINLDSFLVEKRGFRKSICKPQSWYVAAMRIDPCRLRVGQENKTIAEIESCSRGGVYSEVRFVLQAVEKTERGFIFPDAALHLSFSIPRMASLAKKWRQKKPLEIISEIKNTGRWNDASLFLGGAGLERWTFARARFEAGQWKKDVLPHGGFFESLSDADLHPSSVRTQRPQNESKFSTTQLLAPLQINPLQGSCVDCHLADSKRPPRLFRQMGWGFQGESVVSARVQAESFFAARELEVLKNSGK